MKRPSAVVTGAGSGIGRETAARLAREGFDVLLVGRRASPLEAVAAEIRLGAAAGTDVEADAFVGDVGDRAIAEGMVDHCVRRFGRIDVLINNAGLAPLLPIDQTDGDAVERVYRVNALGPAWAIARTWPHFVRQQSGCIVNVSTMGTIDPFPGFFAYASSKAAVNVMAQSCAKEGASVGVRAFAVAPGAVETPMLRGLFGPEQIPPEACLSPADVARVIVDCVMGRRDGDNGRTIPLTQQ